MRSLLNRKYSILVLYNYHININHNLITHKLPTRRKLDLYISKYLEDMFALEYKMKTVFYHSINKNLKNYGDKILQNKYNF